MKKIANKPTLLVIAAVILILAAFFGIKTYIERPTNLGLELEYVGKWNYGCYVFCDSRPGSTYYFATNLSVQELKGYFKNAQSIDHNSLGGSSAQYTFKDLYFRPKSGGDRDFIISYYDNSQVVVDMYKLNKTDKKLILSMGDESYSIAKSSL